MKDCVFCKIVKEEMPSVKIWEDEKHIAILDKFPNTKGMTLVLTKNHFNSDVTQMNEKDYCDLMIAAKRVAEILKEKLDVKKVAIVLEGEGVNHVHVKLYPLHGLNEILKENLNIEQFYFDKYLGYISTQIGFEKSVEELENIAKEIRGEN